jgi:peptidylprolyl isomerase
MLVLTRRIGEAIVIEGAIHVTVLAVKGTRVRLGVVAPASVRIDRWEVHQRQVSGPARAVVSVSPEFDGGCFMQAAQAGDRVQVHYVKRWQDGSVKSSRARPPLELTVGIDHPRLPGLGLALVGLAPGSTTTVKVPAECAYGLPRPTRVHRLARARFTKDQPLAIGKWVRLLNREGRPRLVRIVEVQPDVVVIDANHRRAGQALELEVELIGIQSAGGSPAARAP